jgi:hypothetical protein
VPATALAVARRREADPKAVMARTGAEHWARASIGQHCGLSIVNVRTGDLSPSDRQDFTMHWSVGWQVMAVPGTTPDPAAAEQLAAAMVRPCLDLPGGRLSMVRGLGEVSLLLRIPRKVAADPEPVLMAYAGAMAGYPALACDDAIRSWPDAHDFWPDWPGLRDAIRERAAVLSDISAALLRWVEAEGRRATG